MSDEIKVNSENTLAKNLATLGQVKDALDKRDKKIGKLKEDLGNKLNIQKNIEGEINIESNWSIGVIDRNNQDLNNEYRIRTIALPITSVESVDAGYEYAIVLLDQSQNVLKENNAYLGIYKKDINSSATYYTNETTAEQMKKAAPKAVYMRVILRKKDESNFAMQPNMCTHIHIAKCIIKVKNAENILSTLDYDKDGLIIENGVNNENEIWKMYSKRFSFGMDLSIARVPVFVNNQMFVNGTIIAKNNGTKDTNRWGYHVFEAYAKDNYSRATMLLDKHSWETPNKPSLELYYYTGDNHNAKSYGNTKIGSDVRNHSFIFDRDKMTAFGEIDCMYPITLARISPSADLNNIYSKVEDADNAFEPESKAVENIRCLKYIALKNAVNGAVFYDKDRNKVVCKINGKWCDLQFSDASSNYDF